MPELPEVETIKRSLSKKIIGLEITGVTVYLPKVIRMPDQAEFEDTIKGQKITGLSRRGKYLLVHLTSHLNLIIHLRMTGRLVCTEASPPVKHTHLVFHLDNGFELHFIDVRQFGRVILAHTTQLDTIQGLKDLGPEPLSDNFNISFLRRELKRRRTRIKSLLLDQAFIAGLGNIYVDEALNRARINPKRIACSLTPREISNLHRSIVEVLQDGIANRGTTFRDYVDGNGRAGNYQQLLRVYGREGLPCPNCKTGITKVKLGGRSTFFCPNCQKGDK